MKRPGDAFICNVCGALKGATNHWRVLSLGTVKVKEDGDAPLWDIRELTISEWHSVLALADGVAHACGNNCTQKLVERYLHSGTLEAPHAAGGAA
jgi:hypothetical protein